MAPLISISVLLLVSFSSRAHSISLKALDDKIGPVRLVNILYRHGDRTPTSPYNNDPYKNESYWPEGWGQLTSVGKLRQFKLGQWLRENYIELLGVSSYAWKKVRVVSTDVERTLMSAEANLAGMFPPTDGEAWEAGMPWQPLPVHTVPLSLDKVLAVKADCPAIKKEKKKAKKAKASELIDSRFTQLYQVLTEYTGKKVKNYWDTEHIYSTLNIQNLRGLKLDNWTSLVFPEPIKSAAGFSFALESSTPRLKQLRSGLLLEQMLNNFGAKRVKKGELKEPVEEEQLQELADELEYGAESVGDDVQASGSDVNVVMWIYSGHDSTVSSLLNSLSLFDMEPPPFAATVLFELRTTKDGQDFVNLAYKKGVDQEAKVLEIPGCGAVCPLDTFAYLYREVIPDDWDKLCSTTSSTDQLDHNLPFVL